MMRQPNAGKISRRNFIGTAAAVLGGGLLAGCGSKPLGATKRNARPNLVFVFSDQQSRDMLGCYGNEDIITPNLDRFASEGIRFNQCISNCPVCTPFRSMLLSGKHPLYTGTYTNDQPLLINNGKTFGEVLKDAGYRTGYVGKWHLLGGDRKRPIPAGPQRFGFDDMFLSNNCHVDFRPGKCYYWNEEGEKVFFDEWEVYGQTRQALSFLHHAEASEPFALFISWHPPHDWGLQPDSLIFVYETLPELMELYDPQKIRLRPSASEHPHLRQAYHGYYSMCTGVDRAFGWLMDKLREKGIEDNTIVVYASDHGDNLSSYGYRIPKNHPEDTSTRVPFLVRWPNGLPKGKTSELLLGPMDMMPTLLSFMGLPLPQGLHGKDLSKPILKGDDDAVQSQPLFFYEPSWHGVYTREVTYGFGRMRHFAHGPDGQPFLRNEPLKALYDRRNDSYQLNNLIDQPSARALRAEMEKLTNEWCQRFGYRGSPNWHDLSRVYKMPDGSWPQDVLADGFPGLPIELVQRII